MLRPCFTCRSSRCCRSQPLCFGSRLPTVPSGDISVIPQPCMTNAPNCVSKRSLIARGAAEPPITIRVSESSSRGFDAARLDVREQHQPNGGHAERERHPFRLHQFVDALAVERRARQHELRPRHRARVRHPPRVDVEHRHDEQRALRRRQTEPVDRCTRRTSAAPSSGASTARLSGSPSFPTCSTATRPCARRTRATYMRAAAPDQFFVAEEVRHVDRRHVRAIGHRDESLDRLQLRRELFHERREGRVEKDIPVGRVVDDVGDLLRKKPRIDRVQHRAHSRHAEVELHVPVAVPRERRDAIAGRDPKRGERVRDLLGPAMDVAIRAAVDRPFDRARHDLGIRMAALRVLDQRRNEQRALLHQSLHRASPWLAPVRGHRPELSIRRRPIHGRAPQPVSSIRKRPRIPSASAGENPCS